MARSGLPRLKSGGALCREEESTAMNYGRSGTGADSGELAGETDQPHVGQPRGEWGKRDTQLRRRTNWAWIATGSHHDWMESHTLFAHFE